MFSSLLSLAALALQSTPPNIVLILGDDVGYGELQCYNPLSVTPTPHLDALAASGVRFTNAHVAAPVCAPSRAALMTGKFPSRFGFEMNATPEVPNFGLPLKQIIMPERMRHAGYNTAAIGKWHLGWEDGMQPQQRGFDSAFGFAGAQTGYYETHKLRTQHPIYRNGVKVSEAEYLTFALRREAVSYIQEQAGKQKPFFLYLPFSAIHTPFEAPQEYLDRFPNITDRKRKYLSAMLSAQDDAIGEVMTAIHDQGIEGNTLVIFLSDNGGEFAPHVDNRPLKGHKFNLFEGGIRVPMIMRWAGKPWSNGQAFNGLASEIDILPTMLGLAGQKIPTNIDGVDLMPRIRGNVLGHPPLFYRYGPEWAVISDKWKLLHEVNNDTLEARDWLFDLSTDIGEQVNLKDVKPTIAANLKKEYADWAKTLPEPLWYSWPGYNNER